jgi:hypothetical protein
MQNVSLKSKISHTHGMKFIAGYFEHAQSGYREDSGARFSTFASWCGIKGARCQLTNWTIEEYTMVLGEINPS